MRTPQYTLRFLLIVLTLSAVGGGVWRTWFRRRKLELLDSVTVKVGMNQLQVRYLLGPPHYTYTQRSPIWAYQIEHGSLNFQKIVFVNGKVKRIEHFNWSADMGGAPP